jgi:alpha-beta hydrolase superfamily lysophospholipase
MYHEIFNEVDRERVFADVESWLLRSPGAAVSGSTPAA